jgi:acyl-CoA dehydrogenase
MFDVLLTEDQKKLRQEVRDFVKSVPKQLILDMDADKVIYPKEYLEELGKRNLIGLRFPKKYGGRGLKWVDETIALSEIAVLGSSLACLYSLPSIVGEAISMFGTEDQKKRYLLPTLQGKIGCAEALTEPRGGSDFFGAATVAERDGDQFILNGEKRFVVGSEGADYFMVYAKTDPEASPRDSLSVLLVDRDESVKVEHVYGLLGTRGGGTGRVRFKDTRVPAENLVGELNKGSIIFYQMMIPERLTTAAGSVGGAQAALDVAARYASKRKAFGTHIRNFQAISFKIADSIMKLDAVRGLVYATARAADEEKDRSLVRRMVSEAKRFGTETAWEVVNTAMQITGGIGYTNVYPIERALRDARLGIIWTGTSEVMSLIIQHEYFKQLAKQRDEVRDFEADAENAEAPDEKIYE